MVRRAFVTDGALHDYRVAEHEVREQSSRSADGDEGPPTRGDDFFQESGGDRCTDAGVKHHDPARPVHDREDRVMAVRGGEDTDLLGTSAAQAVISSAKKQITTAGGTSPWVNPMGVISPGSARSSSSSGSSGG